MDVQVAIEGTRPVDEKALLNCHRTVKGDVAVKDHHIHELHMLVERAVGGLLTQTLVREGTKIGTRFGQRTSPVESQLVAKIPPKRWMFYPDS
jgi:hypothetical protein